MPKTTLKLDPWAASSLLHKAIRRGEVELAQRAAASLIQYRGQAIWRRLTNIGFEDIGIADPDLVLELSRLANDKQLRAVLGADFDLIADLTRRMAEAPKDRSTDYLICATLKLDRGRAEQSELANKPVDEQVDVAADVGQPLIRRAAASLLACTRDDKVIVGRPLDRLFEALEAVEPSPLYDAVRLAAKKGLGAYILMATLLWSAYRQDSPGRAVSQIVPAPEWLGEVPLYTFDKHTAAGKNAITRFAQECSEVRMALAEHVPTVARTKVALMAAFYADAVPISLRLAWPQSWELEELGFEADMHGAGCPKEGMTPVLAAVLGNLDQLNACRREVAQRGLET